MIAKLLLTLLVLAAFGYALWLLLRNQPLPIPDGSRPIGRTRYLFLLATVLLLFGLQARGEDKQPTCYAPLPPKVENTSQKSELVRRLALAWRVLNAQPIHRNTTQDEMKSAIDAFAVVMKEALEANVIAPELAQPLIALHTDLANHHWRTNGRVTCYKSMLLPLFMSDLLEQIQKQLTLLRDAEVTGGLSPEMRAKLLTTLESRMEAAQQWSAIMDSKEEFANKQKKITELKTLLDSEKLAISPLVHKTANAVLQLEQLAAEDGKKSPTPAAPVAPVAPVTPTPPPAPGAK